MRFLFIFIVIFITVRSVKIKKCCPKGEVLDSTMECQPQVNATDWILSDYFVIQSSESIAKIPKNNSVIINEIYKSKVDVGFPKCDWSVKDVTTMWKDVQLTKRFYLLYDIAKSTIFLNFHRKSASDDNASLTFSKLFAPELYCIDSGPDESFVSIVCPCSNDICIRKCCHENLVYDEVNGGCIELENVTTIIEDYVDWTPKFKKSSLHKKTDDSNKYFLLMGNLPPCINERGVYILNETTPGSFLYSDDGTLNVNTTIAFDVSVNEHCGEYGWNATRGTLRQVSITCFSEASVEERKSEEETLPFYGFLMSISAFLLIASAMVLILGWNPDVAGRRGSKPVLYHVICLAMGNTAVVLSYILTNVETFSCITAGYLIQWSFLATFFWLNVICIDMSWTFSSIRAPTSSQNNRKEQRKLLIYSIYAWGSSSLITLITIIVDFSLPEEYALKPNIGDTKCWFKQNSSLWLYFYGPVGILLTSNLVLFVYTSVKILVLKRGTKMLRQVDSSQHGPRASRRNKRFILYTKLFLLMGITWLTEVISSAVGDKHIFKYIWIIADAINLLRAVFVFIIFCWKPAVWENLKTKMPCIQGLEKYWSKQSCSKNMKKDDPEDDSANVQNINKETETDENS